MPNKKAAVKSLRQDKKKHDRNKAVLSEIRTLQKKARTSIDSKNGKEADVVLKTLESKLSKATKTKTVKKNNAARHIGRLKSQRAKIEAK